MLDCPQEIRLTQEAGVDLSEVTYLLVNNFKCKCFYEQDNKCKMAFQRIRHFKSKIEFIVTC